MEVTYIPDFVIYEAGFTTNRNRLF